MLLLPSLFAVAALAAPQETKTITVSAPSPTDEPSYTSEDKFKTDVLDTHNRFRDEHSVSSLRWNDTLAEFAADYLDDVAQEDKCKFEHSGGPYGENLALGYGNASANVLVWGDERRHYDYGRGEFSEETGHFTQLVWRNTTDVGCDRKLCGDGGNDDARRWFVVCEYWPRGNVVGAFKDMVQRPKDGVDIGSGGNARPGPSYHYWVGCGVLTGLMLAV